MNDKTKAVWRLAAISNAQWWARSKMTKPVSYHARIEGDDIVELLGQLSFLDALDCGEPVIDVAKVHNRWGGNVSIEFDESEIPHGTMIKIYANGNKYVHEGDHVCTCENSLNTKAEWDQSQCAECVNDAANARCEGDR